MKSSVAALPKANNVLNLHLSQTIRNQQTSKKHKTMAFKFTDSNVKEVIASGKPVVIDFWATWCGPCMRLAPVIDELAEKYADQVVIGKYNIEEESDLSTDYRIMSIPTILFFKNGEQVRDLRMTGATKDELIARIEKLLAM